MSGSRSRWRTWGVILLCVVPVVLAGILIQNFFFDAEPEQAPRAPEARGTVLRVYDYDKVRSDLDVVGDGRVWRGEQEPRVDGRDQDDRIRIVEPPDVPGDGDRKPTGNVMRVEVRPYDGGDGDVTKTDGYKASRAEVFDRQAEDSDKPASEWPDPKGSTRWYSFALYLESPWQFAKSGDRWLTVTQWKGVRTGSPPVALELFKDMWRLGGKGGYSTLAPAKVDTWVQFEIGLHFSADPDVGWAEVWIDGENVLPRTDRATLNRDGEGTDPAYLKQGIYRSKDWKTAQVAYFGPLTIGTTRDAVI